MLRTILFVLGIILTAPNAQAASHGQCTSNTLTSVSSNFGYYNLTDGTHGPWWVAQSISNPTSVSYSGVTYNGTTTVSAFGSTAGIISGASAYGPKIPGSTTVAAVGTSTITLSQNASGSATGSYVNFGLLPSQYLQTIVSCASTFPAGTLISWSYPGHTNDVSVYAYPNIAYGNAGNGYYSVPANNITPLVINSIVNLSLTYNVTINADADSYDLLIELYPDTTTSDTNPPTTLQNELSFLGHTPPLLATYILGLATNYNYSTSGSCPDPGGFYAYIATKPGGSPGANPTETFIMPVTTCGGTTPLDMISGTQTYPIKGIMAFLVAQGIVTGTNYLNGAVLGFEIRRNSGTAIINSIAWSWQ